MTVVPLAGPRWRSIANRLLIFFALAGAPPALAPPSLEAGEDVSQHGEALEKIRDNLFILEEAYNQEPGVVQHIQTF